MKKTVVIAIFILAALGVAFWVRFQGKSQIITIGAILPLSGDVAFLGESLRDGLLLAQEDLGDTRYKYELIFEDSHFEAAKAVTAAEKLIALHDADVLITLTSREANALKNTVSKRGIIQFSTASDPNAADGRFNFIHWTPAEKEAETLVDELKKRDIRSVAIFTLNQQGALAMRAATKERLGPIRLLVDEVFNPNESDFRTPIAKASTANPDIYILLAFTPELEILAKQIKDAGIKTPLTSIESFELTEHPELFEGYWYINAADPTNKFIDDFHRRYGKAPNLGAANGYDILKMIVSSAETRGSTAAELSSGLKSIKNFEGALGELNMSGDGVVVSQPSIRMIKEGKPRTIK